MKKIDPIVEKSWAQTVPTPKFASILIVDDQRFDRTRLRRLCGELDFDTYVVEAASLETMGTALDRDTFDLVILDYNLPDGTGLAAIPAIRSHRVHRQAAIIIITGQHDAGVAIEAMKSGCSDYIDKNGLSLDSLRRASINALQKSALSAGMEAQEMMRQMRNLSDGNGFMDPQTKSELDTSCMRLWDFVTDLESFDGRDIVDTEFPEQPRPAKRDREPAASGRPVRQSEPDIPKVLTPSRPSAKAGRLFAKHARPGQ